jgi:hypothetical protein
MQKALGGAAGAGGRVGSAGTLARLP